MPMNVDIKGHLPGVALLLYFTGWQSAALSSLGLVLLGVWTFWQAKRLVFDLRYCTWFWLSLAAIIFLLLRTFFNTEFPVTDDETKHLAGYLYLWIFPIFAYAIYRGKISVPILLLVSTLALLTRILLKMNWDQFPEILPIRYGFDFQVNVFSLFACAVLLGLIVLMGQFKRIFMANKIVGMIVWVILVTVFTVIVISTLTRGAWLGLGVALFVAALLQLQRKSSRGNLKNSAWKVLLVAAVIVTSALFFGKDRIIKRILTDKATYAQILTADRDKIPYTSVGVRAHMNIYGLQKWTERPLLGWGVGTADNVLDQDQRLKGWYHLHNGYVQILVEQGLLGFLLYAAGFIIMMTGLLKAGERSLIPADILIFLISMWVLVLVWHLTDTWLTHRSTRLLLLPLTGISFSYLLKDALDRRREH